MGFQTGMEGGFLARRRHLDALEKACRTFTNWISQLTEFHAGELLAEELRLVQANLSEITGNLPQMICLAISSALLYRKIGFRL